jgi:hypothetical protein
MALPVLAGLVVCGRAEEPTRSLIELRTYSCSSVAKRDELIRVFDRALIPALNRQGIAAVGVFRGEAAGNGGDRTWETNVFVVIPHRDAASLTACDTRLLADEAFLRNADALFRAPMASPLYDACGAALLLAFESCPGVSAVTRSPDRVLQLRIYNSYTEERNAKKIAMFEAGGEIALFRECGLTPVFFGRALAGGRMPNLTYLLGFPDREAQRTAWERFRAHPGWLKLKADPQYRDTANKIANILLRPSPGSQL